MGTYEKVLLSGSSQGRGILVAATSTPGTTIHATGISATIDDEIYLYASNTDTTDRKLTVEFGGATVGDQIEFTVKAESGLYLIVPGLVLTGTGAAATTVRAFAATGSVINIFGYVNRITP
jgi:hypothetical protein